MRMYRTRSPRDSSRISGSKSLRFISIHFQRCQYILQRCKSFHMLWNKIRHHRYMVETKKKEPIENRCFCIGNVWQNTKFWLIESCEFVNPLCVFEICMVVIDALPCEENPNEKCWLIMQHWSQLDEYNGCSHWNVLKLFSVVMKRMKVSYRRFITIISCREKCVDKENPLNKKRF